MGRRLQGDCSLGEPFWLLSSRAGMCTHVEGLREPASVSCDCLTLGFRLRSSRPSLSLSPSVFTLLNLQDACRCLKLRLDMVCVLLLGICSAPLKMRGDACISAQPSWHPGNSESLLCLISPKASCSHRWCFREVTRSWGVVLISGLAHS